MKKIALFATALLVGCASSSGVIDAGNGNLYASKQAATGFSGPGNLKSEVLTEAAAYCTAHGAHMQTVKVTEAQPPFILGNYPRAEIEFRCNNSQ